MLSEVTIYTCLGPRSLMGFYSKYLIALPIDFGRYLNLTFYADHISNSISKCNMIS